MTSGSRIWERLAWRVLYLIGRARVNLIDDSGPVQKAQVTVNGLETIDTMPRVQEFGFTSVPPKDSDATLVFIGGDRSNGVIVATNHQGTRPRGLQAGETMIYTQDGKQIYLTASGGLRIAANGQPVEVDNATVVTIKAATKIRAETPRFECTGDIVDNCDTQTSTLAQLREAYDAHDHEVVDVQTGGSTIKTEGPNSSV